MHSYIYQVKEKSNILSQEGKHVFLTNGKVNKIEAKKDLEKLYGEIKSINALNVPEKIRKVGKKTIRKRKPATKLIVTFKSKDVKINS